VNAGSTWLPQSTPGVSADISSIYCPHNSTCYAVGDSGVIIKTTNGGITWIEQESGISSTLNSVYCTDINTCYAVGDSGVILKTISGGVGISTISEKKTEVTVFPNPSNGQFTLEFDIWTEKQSKLIIVNVLGEEVYYADLQSNYGIFQERINLGHCAEGIYFLSLRNETGLRTMRIAIQ